MIKLVKNIDEASFVTHSGKFHADEVFSSILLEKIFTIKIIIQAARPMSICDSKLPSIPNKISV